MYSDSDCFSSYLASVYILGEQTVMCGEPVDYTRITPLAISIASPQHVQAAICTTQLLVRAWVNLRITPT